MSTTSHLKKAVPANPVIDEFHANSGGFTPTDGIDTPSSDVQPGAIHDADGLARDIRQGFFD